MKGRRFEMITTKDAKEVAKFWGDKMPLMACEEMGELIQAISKYERKKPSSYFDDELKKNIEKEIADVMISMHALSLYYEMDPKSIDDTIDMKLAKRYEKKLELTDHQCELLNGLIKELHDTNRNELFCLLNFVFGRDIFKRSPDYDKWVNGNY